jgi:hypothetical protein
MVAPSAYAARVYGSRLVMGGVGGEDVRS